MAISNTSTNYSGRKKDISIMTGVVFPGPAVVTPSFGKVSNYCAGVQKLVQRYAIRLLTELGSQEPFPTFGSTLITRLKNSASVINREDVAALFGLANVKIVREFRDYQAENPSSFPDEELDTALLENIVLSAGQVSLKIKLITVQKTPIEFLIPVP